MLFDPIGLNFLHGTGGYAWQLAEFMSAADPAASGQARLARPSPPQLHEPLQSFPEKIKADVVVAWRAGLIVRPRMAALIGRRGTLGFLVVALDAQCFGTFDAETTEALATGVPAGRLDRIFLNGEAHMADQLLISMIRHGLAAGDLGGDATSADSYVVEPTAVVRETRDFGWVGINQLSGRTIALDRQRLAILDHPAGTAVPLNQWSADLQLCCDSGLIRLCAEKVAS